MILVRATTAWGPYNSGERFALSPEAYEKARKHRPPLVEPIEDEKPTDDAKEPEPPPAEEPGPARDRNGSPPRRRRG